MSDARYHAVPQESQQCSREHKASLFSRAIFFWINPLIKTGYRKPLTRDDLWSINPDRQVENHAKALTAALRRRSAAGHKHPLLWALHDVFKFEFWLLGCATLTANVFQILSPLVLRYILQFVTRTKAASLDSLNTEGVLLSLAMFVTQSVMSFGLLHWMYVSDVLSAEVKASMMQVIFEKSLTLPASVKNGSTTKGDEDGEGTGWPEGKIVNLISTDSSRIAGAIRHGHMVWTGPVMLILCLTFLFLNLGYSMIPGLLLLILATELMNRALALLYKKRATIQKIVDERVELSKQMLQGIHFIKYYAWESTFLRHILDARAEELKHVRILYTVWNASSAVTMAIPHFALVLAFTIFALTGHELHAARVFSSLALFNCLRMPLVMVPAMMAAITNALVSTARIQRFLLEDRPDDIQLDNGNDAAIWIDNAIFSWQASKKASNENDTETNRKIVDEETPLLHEPTRIEDNVPRSNFALRVPRLHIEPSEFMIVTGRVGSGKSSLLSAISGEMVLQEGKAVVNGLVIHCTQSPWLISGTIKENVVFGKKFDRERFNEVINACALGVDLDAMPNGSETKIGERGVTLSGGQKQRVGLARAIYSDCPIILLDDPLSAVDAKVGQHILENAIFGPLLQGRCVVLATHQLHVLPRANRITWMEDGNIKAADTFSYLKQAYPEFEALVKDLAAKPSHDISANDQNAKTEDRKADLPLHQLIKDEYQDVGVVSVDVYQSFIRSGGYSYWLAIIILLALSRSSFMLGGLVLAWWTSDVFGLSRGIYIGIYAGSGALHYSLSFLYNLLTMISGLRSSSVLLHNALARVFVAPISFFNTTPTGRLLNLFTRDVDLIDGGVAGDIVGFLSSVTMVLAVITLVVSLLPWVAPALALLGIGFLYSGLYYRRTGRELKRHEAVLRAVCMSQSTEAITGSSTIRAYRAEDVFVRRLSEAINNMSTSTHLVAAVRQWLTIRVETVGNIIVLLSALMVVYKRHTLDPGLSGMLLTYVLTVVNQLGHVVQVAGDVEDDMVPVERMKYYSTAIPNELDAESEKEDNCSAVAASWPSDGHLQFKSLTINYASTSTSALSNITIDIAAGSCTAIVGRTGAGKSTLLASLFRMSPAPSTGVISIDNTDISLVPLQKLRSSIAIVTQDSFCWKGTVHDNVDPQHVLPDDRTEEMLQKCGLVDREIAPSSPDSSKNLSGTSTPKPSTLSLTTPISSSGANLSLGQRQLLSLARALLRNTRILVLDEATSALDPETDALVLDLVREQAQERGLTVLFVAHRIGSVKRLGVDNVVVLEGGKVVEQGRPEELYGKEEGWFAGAAKRSGVVF